MSQKAHAISGGAIESLNEVANYLKLQELAGGNIDTRCIVLRDVNGDGRIDIVIGNEK